MDPIARMVAAGAAGAAGGESTYVDDVFSTYLYNGNGSTQTIANGIDLSGEGGLVWIKNRDDSSGWAINLLFDTERSPTISDNPKYLRSDSTNGENGTGTDATKDFGGWASNGFLLGEPWSLGADALNNSSGDDYASWTFRKAPGFFDIVTYTGTGANRSIAHSLGSVPGCILIKCTSRSGDDWIVYHRSVGNTKFLNLNQSYGASTDPAAWNSSTPTSTVFYLGTKGQVNTLGQSYVAYIFAHDDQSFGTNGDEAIVKCGSYTGTGGYQTIDIGFEAQWVLIKGSSASYKDWGIFDIMRGAPGGGNTQTKGGKRLKPNATSSEDGSSVGVYSNGFLLDDGSGEINTSGVTYIYMAIRRPNKPPEDGTDVFAIDTSDATSPSPPQFTSGFVTDFIIRKTMNGANAQIGSRLQGIGYMNPYSTSQESSTATALTWDFMDGWSNSSGVNTNLFCYMFKRAPGFFDVVAYKGTGSTTAHTHNLGVTPELIIVKNRTHPLGYTFLGWPVYNSADGASEVMQLNRNDASDIGNSWAHTAPTSTTFTTGTGAALNSSGANYVAYLFASLAGISKVGTYTGTGSAINVDCGFTAGARFVMIKRRDSTGGWYVWDSTNGIVSGNDPYWIINDPVDSGAVTNTDYIDPLNAGFTVTASGQGDINANGGTYLFLAIA